MGLAEHAATIEMLAQKHQPKVVVEIGLKYSTDVLIPIFKKYGLQRYIGIDPVDRYQCPSEHADVFVYMQGYSLDLLPTIPDMNLVMIDGDHTYYTVNQELKLLHQYLKSQSVILLHDVEEPWARKDLYYNKELIPPEYIDGPKQGVLTAVEDFLTEYGQYYTPLEIFHGHNGLGYFVRQGEPQLGFMKRWFGKF